MVAWGWIPRAPHWPVSSGRVERRIRYQRIAHPLEKRSRGLLTAADDQASAHARCGTRIPNADRRFEMNAEDQYRSA